MADKVFIGGLCPKFIICSDWFVNGNGIEWVRVCGVVFYADELALGLGCASAMGVARLGRVDKELVGIFTLCFVFGVVWRRFFPMGCGVVVGGVFVMGRARLECVDSLWRIKFLLGDYALNL